MIIGHHIMWTASGWWLPNDPRGSMSRNVAIEPIAKLGEHHYGRKIHQPSSREIREFYDEAKDALTHELLTFDDEDTRILARCFAETIRGERYTCAIMPDHVHLLIRKHKHKHSAETMIDHLRDANRGALIEAKRRSLEHPVWGSGPGWKVFQQTTRQVRITIEYIRRNPVKIGRPVQDWKFVMPYDGWVPGRHPECTAYDRAKR